MRWILLLIAASLSAQTISDKKASLQDQGMSRSAYLELTCVNEELKRAREELSALYARANQLEGEEDFALLLKQIADVRKEVEWIETMWREAAQSEGEEGAYALWHQPQTTLEQLIIDYGSADYVYLIPQEVGSMPVSVTSNLPVPRESWDELLTLMFRNNGVGIKQISPLVRQLYIIQEKYEACTHVTDDQKELLAFPPNEQVCFMLDGVGIDHLTRFIDPETTEAHEVASSLFLFGPAEEILRLLKIHSFVEKSIDQENYQLITLQKVPSTEMGAILAAQMETLKILPIESSALFIWGSEAELARAKKIVETVEKEMNDPKEMTVYTYTCLHSDPAELGEALEKVYELMGEEPQGNFVVYPKTGSIVMVVEQELLPKLKRLLGRIDVPRKMVRIDVLFFEKKLTGEARFGLDLLHFGQNANQKRGLAYKDGLLSFLIGQSKSPAYDIAYQFLLSQDDISINAHPSVTTMNQTPAMIQLVEEISIDTGAVIDGKDHLKRSFTRTEYGIKLKITPTVHSDWEGDGDDLIHLETDVLFDTIGATKEKDRPPVARRHITNEVRVADGETVILGGLRSKESQDSTSGLPFLGEIPYLGKLFGSTHMRDQETEMFIFITPHIIQDPAEEMRKFRTEELTKRPGDTPEFLEKLGEGKRAICERSLQAVLGR